MSSDFFAFAPPIPFQIANGNVKKGPKNDLLVMCVYCQSITRLFNFVVVSVFRMWDGVKSGQI